MYTVQLFVFKILTIIETTFLFLSPNCCHVVALLSTRAVLHDLDILVNSEWNNVAVVNHHEKTLIYT